MGKYFVTVPVDCSVELTIEANSEEEAKEKALKAEINVTIEGEGNPTFGDFELIPRVNQGNVCYITQWDIEVEEATW